MGLSCRLFQGNRALEACATVNSAHVTLGATGDHVARIQFALFTLDNLVIDRNELLDQSYGPSTAAAVLAYKKKRRIINPAYQSAPDAIVGKMTIASLDKEMRQREVLRNPPGDCATSPQSALIPIGDFATPAAGFQSETRSLTGAQGITAAKGNRQLGGVVRVYFAITSRSALEDGFPIREHIEVARDTLFEHGVSLSVEISNGFADTIRFPDRIEMNPDSAAENVTQLRQASETTRPGLTGILRVIVCPMGLNSDFGDTMRNRSLGGTVVKPFVLLNSQLRDRSHATLIHEMIHASKDGPVDHDPEPFSVFFKHGIEKLGGVDQRLLKPQHALSIARSFFAIGGPP